MCAATRRIGRGVYTPAMQSSNLVELEPCVRPEMETESLRINQALGLRSSLIPLIITREGPLLPQHSAHKRRDQHILQHPVWSRVEPPPPRTTALLRLKQRYDSLRIGFLRIDHFFTMYCRESGGSDEDHAGRYNKDLSTALPLSA